MSENILVVKCWFNSNARMGRLYQVSAICDAKYFMPIGGTNDLADESPGT